MIDVNATPSVSADDQQAYEEAKSELHEKHINDRNTDGDSLLRFFGYDSDGRAIFAVLPEDLPTWR